MSYKNIENFAINCKLAEKYNFEEESDISVYLKSSTFERYFIYKAVANPNCKNSVYESGKAFAVKYQDSEVYKTLADCDGTGSKIPQKYLCVLAREVYRTLWGWKDIPAIERRNMDYNLNEKERFGKCKLQELGMMGPDTMNSAQTLVNDIIRDIVSKEENADLSKVRKGNFSLNYILELFANKTYNIKMIDELEKVDKLKEYLDEYHKIGNFVLVPAYFNPYRATIVNDYWYSSLALLKEKNEEWFFRNEKITWNKDNYNLYINFFFLWDYLDEKGKVIDYTGILKTDRSKYLEEMINKIKRRSNFMVMLLKLYNFMGLEAYEQMRNNIFIKAEEIYPGYDKVVKSIKEYISDNDATFDTNKETKKSIDTIIVEYSNYFEPMGI